MISHTSIPLSGFVMACLISATGSGAELPGTPSTFQANAQMVLVPVLITDSRGKPVPGLQAKNFAVFDDRTPQRIVSFTREDAPSSIGIVLDISGSMRSTLGAAKSVAAAFVDAANPEDEFLLMTVSTEPAAAPAFTKDLAMLARTIDLSKSGEMTALVDTVYLGLGRMRRGRHPRRALLILSDGMDNYSRYSPSELMRAAMEADLQIYTIIIETGSGASGAALMRPGLVKKPYEQGYDRQGPALLEKLSDKTGGIYFHANNNADAKAAAVKAGQAIRSEYVIGYVPGSPDSGGKWHRVRVKSNIPGAVVHSRNGYYSR
jgi:Ca-activated chloride channel family protein